MSRGVRSARKMKAFVKDRVAPIASEDDWEAALQRSGPRLLVIEFAAVRAPARAAAKRIGAGAEARCARQSWSEPCKQMAQVLGALARQPDYSQVDFARVDLEACPVRRRRAASALRAKRMRRGLTRCAAQALGAKRAVLAAPTYHFYRAGEMVTSFSGAMPHRLIELLDTHKGKAEAKRGGTKLMALLGILAAGGAALALSNALSRAKPAAPAAAIEAPPPPPPERAEENAADHAAESEGARELAAPVKKAASSPSAGARLER